MARMLLGVALAAAAVAACYPPAGGRPPTLSPVVVRDGVAEPDPLPPPIVQVRKFPAFVSVVAWDADDAAFGLRTSVNARGVRIDGRRFGDHELYVTPFYANFFGGFTQAAVLPTKWLLRTGINTDVYSCFFGSACSPTVTLGVSVPDSLLRTNRDSLMVTFIPHVYEPWVITLRRELIAEYLTKVDSVVAEMQKSDAR